MSNAPSKPVSFSRPKVGYFSNRPRIYKKFYLDLWELMNNIMHFKYQQYIVGHKTQQNIYFEEFVVVKLNLSCMRKVLLI